ncbi:MAG: hypothetical protein ACRDSK_15450 [Actinophytocola sp.]|uniref:hypothetical protein n=1 Tax=Actinophytocola sp. TaxID=1872138 RepID=UPI003D6BE8F8
MKWANSRPAGARPMSQPLHCPVLVVDSDAIVGRVLHTGAHPNGERIWLARVDLGNGKPVQIVFGGRYKVRPAELVPVAPPGARVTALNGLTVPRTKKMRNRKYRGERSHGMLCSLDELGWTVGGPDEVAILCGLRPGDSLDCIATHLRSDHVVRPRPLQQARAKPLVLDRITQYRFPSRSDSHEVGRSAAKD